MAITLEDVAAAKAGDKAAVERIVKGCRNFVRGRVKAQARPDIEDDLMQAGMMGVLRAIDRFDATRGSDFINAARWSIQDEIQTERRRLDSDGLTGMSVKRQIKAARDREAAAEAKAMGDDPPKPKGGYFRTANERARLETRPDRLTAVVNLSTIPGGEHDMAIRLDSRKGAELLGRLPAAERRILEMRFYRGRTREDIAHHMGVCPSTIQKIEKRSLDKLRKWMA